MQNNLTTDVTVPILVLVFDQPCTMHNKLNAKNVNI